MQNLEKNLITSSAKRKSSKASALLKNGSGNVFINGKEGSQYFFSTSYDYTKILQPLTILNELARYDIFVKVQGGGIMSQLDAIKLAIAKALSKTDKKNRTILSSQKLLYSDSRIKERRKYGLRKARKAAQYHKR
jgi:small subunit ribosomal protein S9|uniref:Ribosomal protein S9 n=1 Tax=Poterioochromonas malhamensis TaxID=88167 RepID=A0A7T6Y8B3_9STRA|nr:ribosomal protein S9 [Poterioochromonas malhamensis]QQK54981.1 ribosomal protein S9 [Poterioochromonas malhamensis]